MDKGKVSVVIPVRNRADLLRDSIASVAAQSYRPIELIIVDDGSTDETGAVADQLAKEYGSWVQVLHQNASGAGRAREAGRVRASGEFIQYLDSDDRLLSQKFEMQVNTLHSNPACDIAYGITRLIDSDGNIMKEPFKWTGRRIDYLFPTLLVDRWWCTHTPLYRRSLCDRIGAWSDLRYSQDWEYDARAGALGAKLVYVDALVSEHRTHAGTRQTGGGKWLSPSDQVRFFSQLLACAITAGVTLQDKEMKHFGRWVFAAARRAGIRGDATAAQELLSLASQAGTDWDLKLYKKLSAIFGMRVTSKALETMRWIALRRPVKETQKQSWMDD